MPYTRPLIIAPCARCRPQPQDWETNPRRSRGSRPLGPIQNPRDFPPGVSPYARWPPSTHPPPPYQRRRARRSHVKKFCNRTRCACGGGGHRERVSEEGGRGIFTGGDAGKHTHGDTARVGGGFNTGRHPCACVYVHISIHCMVLHACDCICMCTHSLSLSLCWELNQLRSSSIFLSSILIYKLIIKQSQSFIE